MSRGAVPLLLALLAACGPPFAYDPVGSTETGGCLSDAECVTGRCELATGRCRMCLADADCADGRACREGVCALPDGRCVTDAQCASLPGKPRCDAAARRCVQCLSTVDCGGGACEAGACANAAGCTPVAPPSDLVRVGALQSLRSEVSARSYAACVAAGCCEPLPASEGCIPSDDDRPANCVRHADAVRYCAYAGGRLPSGDEWSRLAGGDAQGRYPWGAAPEPGCEHAVVSSAGGAACDVSAPAAACSKPAGASPEGLCDLAGNLWEWTQEAVSSEARVLRGGSFRSAQADPLRNDFRASAEDPSRRLVDAGFRCVW
jgi:formylglycine-generating enzyme required for sulfatase activity